MNLPENRMTRDQERHCMAMKWHSRLIEANLREGLIYLKKMGKIRFSDGELLSFVYDGMRQAVKNYDPSRNRFFTWAKPHIRGKLFIAMRDQSRYAKTMGGEMGGDVYEENMETGSKEDMPKWTNEPSVDFDHEGLAFRTHYYGEIKQIMERVLKPQERRVVTERIWHGLRYREIGEKFKFSTSRAQAIFERAMVLVRRELMRRKRLHEYDPSA